MVYKIRKLKVSKTVQVVMFQKTLKYMYAEIRAILLSRVKLNKLGKSDMK
jgi:hypothetical protein